MNYNLNFLLFFLIFAVGCAGSRIPKTLGDPQNDYSYGYHPLDPLPVRTTDKSFETNSRTQMENRNKRLLKSLPDESMRIAIGNYSRSGGITFGSNAVGYKGQRYIVILDYIKYDTKAFNVGVLKMNNQFNKEQKNEVYILPVDSLLSAPQKYLKQIREYETKKSRNRQRTTETIISSNSFQTSEATLPVFIGVGLRLTATIEINKGSIDLGNLTALGVAAESGNISGTLVIQTLGISGENISNLIMMPSEINTTTIQNAILSLGAIKAKMYEQDVNLIPRIVGLYNNVGGGENAINSFITSFLQVPIEHTIMSE